MLKRKYLIIINFFVIFLSLPKIDNFFHKSLFLNNEEFEIEFKKSLCELIKIPKAKNCFHTIFNNLNFFNELNTIETNISLLIYLNKTNIENILLLMGIYPFLKKNSIASFIIKNKKTFNICRNIFEYKLFIKNSFKIKESDFNKTKSKIINSLDYQWEIIPSKSIINIIRYTLNNYYYAI